MTTTTTPSKETTVTETPAVARVKRLSNGDYRVVYNRPTGEETFRNFGKRKVLADQFADALNDARPALPEETTVTETPAPVSHRQLREIAEAASAARVRRDQEVEDQQATVSALALQLQNAQAVLAELVTDADDAAQEENAAWQAVTDLEVADHEAYLAQQD